MPRNQFTFRLNGQDSTFWTTGSLLQALRAFLEDRPGADPSKVELIIPDASDLLREIALCRLEIQLNPLFSKFIPDLFEFLWNQMLLIDAGEGTVPRFPDVSSPDRHSIDAAYEVAAEWLQERLPKQPAAEPTPQDRTQQADESSLEIVVSDDCRSANWNGVLFEFTTGQAACFDCLYANWLRGTPSVDQGTILDAGGASGKRLADVFNKGTHPAWGKLIVSGGTKGAFRLAPEPPKTCPTTENRT